MAQVSGVKEVTIIYVEFPGEWKEVEQRFPTVHALREYFHEHKRFGEIVGYVVVKNRTPGFNDHIYTGRLEIEWTDNNASYVRRGFKDVWEFVDFLKNKDHKAIADAVEYAAKEIKR